MNGAAQLLRVAHASERCLSNDVQPALRVAAVRIGQQGPVLLGDEEARGDGVDAYPLAELLAALAGHPFRKAHDAGFCCRIAADARDGPEAGHGCKVDDVALALLDHRLQEYLRRDDGARKVQAYHAVEVFCRQVENGALRLDDGSCNVAAGGIEQGVDAAVACHDVVAYLFHLLLLQHVGLDELCLSASLLDVVNDGVAHVFLAS